VIGRLLYDSKQVLDDQLEHVAEIARPARRDRARPRAADRRPARRERAGHHDRRSLTATSRRRPAGSSSPTAPAPAVHAQHVTGASTADLRSFLLDRARARSSNQAATLHQRAARHSARRRRSQQDGISSIHDQATSSGSSRTVAPFIEKLGVRTCVEIPIRRSKGDNVVNLAADAVVRRSAATAHLEQVDVSYDHRTMSARSQPVVIRTGGSRGDTRYAGQLASGSLHEARRSSSCGRRADAHRGDRHVRRRTAGGRGAAVGHAAPRGRPGRRGAGR